MTKYDKLSLLLIVFIIFLSIYSFQYLPDQVPTHWNAKGDVDGWSSKLFAVTFFPGITLFIYLLFLIIPRIAVHKKNIEEFKVYFEGLKFLFVLFLSTIYIATLLVALDRLSSITPVVIVGIAILFYYIGFVMKFMKTNYFIGIRTPWTLASKTSWRKTHILGGKLFKIAAVLFLPALFFPQLFFWVVLVFIFAIVIGLMVYSYVVWKDSKK